MAVIFPPGPPFPGLSIAFLWQLCKERAQGSVGSPQTRTHILKPPPPLSASPPDPKDRKDLRRRVLGWPSRAVLVSPLSSCLGALLVPPRNKSIHATLTDLSHKFPQCQPPLTPARLSQLPAPLQAPHPWPKSFPRAPGVASRPPSPLAWWLCPRLWSEAGHGAVPPPPCHCILHTSGAESSLGFAPGKASTVLAAGRERVPGTHRGVGSTHGFTRRSSEGDSCVLIL